MKYKVIRAFVDRETMLPYNAGYSYETTDKGRAAELQESGYIGAPLAKTKKAADDSKGATSGAPDKK